MTLGKMEAHISTRIHAKTKEQLAKTGYTPRDAIVWFVNEYYKGNPKKKMKIKRDMLELRLHSLKKEECDIQVEISAIERQLESLSHEDLSNIEEVPLIPEVEEDDNEYPVEIIEALELVQSAFDTKRDMLVSPKTDISEAVDSFIVMHGDVVQGAFKMCSGLKWKQFREILLAEIK